MMNCDDIYDLARSLGGSSIPQLLIGFELLAVGTKHMLSVFYTLACVVCPLVRHMTDKHILTSSKGKRV